MNANPLTLPIAIVLVAIVVVALCIRRLRKHQSPQYRKGRRITEWVLLSLVVVLFAVAAGSTLYNAAALRYYRAIYPAPGKMYQVNGHQMHLYCTGEGSPTMVLDAGMGNYSTAWAKVQPELSKTTRVCSYDRAGMGWSTPGPDPRDANEIASELHTLLQQAGVSGPIVLVGHSMGGINIRAYASHYPQDLVGMIFIEGASPLQEDHESAELRAQTLPSALQYYSYVAGSATGLLRLMGECSPDSRFDGQFAKMKGQLDCGMLLSEVWREYTTDRRSGEETINTGPYGNLPILIFSRDPQLDLQDRSLSPNLALELSTDWNRDQEDLKRLSTRSRRIIAKGSGHHLPIDRADLVNREVPIFIQQIRNGELRTDYGSTKTE